MKTSEITQPETTFVATSSFAELLAGLTEKERRDSAAAIEYRPAPVVRTIEIRAGGTILPFRYSDYGTPQPGWLMPVLQGFADLVALPKDWDGEGASRIDTATVNRALAAVERLFEPNSPTPSIVPLSNGGLQLEWHRGGKDLEIEFSPQGRVSFYYFDEQTKDEHEGPVGPDFIHVGRYLDRIW